MMDENSDVIDLAVIKVAKFIRAHARRYGEMHKQVAHFTASGNKGKGFEITTLDLERLVNAVRKRQTSVYGVVWCDKEVRLRLQYLDKPTMVPCVLKRGHKGPCQ